MKPHPPENERAISGELSLQDVGLRLKEVRELRGESLDDVARITRIGKNYLEALEEGAVARLPNQAYTRGFIRLYASHLGISPDETARMLAGKTADAPQHDLPETPVSPSRHFPAEQQHPSPGRAKKLLFAAAGAIALTVIVATFIYRSGPKSSSPAPQTTVLQPAAGTTPAAPEAAPRLPPINTPPATDALQKGSGKAAAEEGIVLRLKVISAGRLHITIDGSVSQEYDLVAGDLVEWKAEKMFLLDLENAGSVEGELDGKALQPFGEEGKAAHLIIRQNGVQKD